MVKFVIFGHPRCGSTYLCSLLDSHPKILCHYEVFHPEAIGTVQGFNDIAKEMSAYTPQTRDERPAEFLETLFKYHMGMEGVGFKIFVDQSRKAHDLILEDTGILKILLRRNTIHSYVSMLIAENTGAFTKMQKPGLTGQVRVPLDPPGLLNFDRVTRQYFAGIRQTLTDTGQRYLEISYEDLVSDQKTLDSVFSFLGIDRGQCELASFTKKQNRKSLEDKVDNFEAVVADFMRLYFDREDLIRNKEEIIRNYAAEIVGRDQQLAERGRQLAERDQQLAERNRQLAERDSRLNEKQERIDELLNSMSWKITAPLRRLYAPIPKKK